MTTQDICKVKAGDILATKYGNLLMVARVEMNLPLVRVYDYFDWNDGMGLQMNEWLTSYYGPKWEDDFYRPATKEEKKFFLKKMREFGYELETRYGGKVPHLTADGYKKFYPDKH